MSKKAAVIKGDGVGPELVDNVLRVMEAIGTDVEFIVCEAGAQWWEEHGGDSLIPDETWEILGSTDAAFKGPTTTPGARVHRRAWRFQSARSSIFMPT